MPWGIAAAVVGGSVVSGIIQGNAAKDAANTQAQAGYASIAEQKAEFDKGQANLAPYLSVGDQALYMLSDYLGLPNPAGSNVTPSDKTGSLLKPFDFDISKDPGYQFRLGQGEQAIENSAAAKGSQLSGATLKELLKYGQDYASGEFNSAFQRDQAEKGQVYSMLTGTAGQGLGATTTGVNAGVQSAAGIGNTITGIGNANAAGTVGSANALGNSITGGINTAAQAYTLNQILGKNNSTAGVNSGVDLGQSQQIS